MKQWLPRAVNPARVAGLQLQGYAETPGRPLFVGSLEGSGEHVLSSQYLSDQCRACILDAQERYPQLAQCRRTKRNVRVHCGS